MKKLVLVLMIVCFSQIVLNAQENNSNPGIVNGSIGVTNNGISLVPTFTINKPAGLLNLSYSKNRLSFENNLTFADDGKPWYSLYWMRYSLVKNEKFNMTAGTHLGLNFKRVQSGLPYDNKTTIELERYSVVDLNTNYNIKKNFSVGVYYMLSHGLDAGTNGAIHFLTLNSNISQIPIGSSCTMSFSPQFYYLAIDKNNGSYFSSSLTLNKNGSPFSLAYLMNKSLNTEIANSDKYISNFSLIYTFKSKTLK